MPRKKSVKGAGARRGAKGGAQARGQNRKVARTKPATKIAGKGAARTNDGCSATIAVKETVGRLTDEATGAVYVTLPSGDAKHRRGRSSRLSERVVRVMAAMGHEARAKIMTTLLKGPADYASLHRSTKLAAGPLYHHINQLRLAGLIRPKQRDNYALTRGGRNMILSAMALGPLIADKRRRPLE